MRASDLLATCLQNLMRRKGRTALTMLGVIVGCCSIIVMVSLGVGSKEAQDKMLEEMGGLTLIQVYSNGGGGGGGMILGSVGMSEGGFSSGGAAKLNKETVEEMQALEHVDAIAPKLTTQNLAVNLYGGSGRRYQAQGTTVIGLDLEVLEKMGYVILEGKSSSRPFSVLIGENFAYSFQDTLRPEGHNMVYPYPDENGKLSEPYFDPFHTDLELEMEGSQAGGNKQTQKLEVSGKLKSDYNLGWETDAGIIMNIKDLQALLRKQHVSSDKINQYSEVMVKVDDIKNVAAVEQAIQAMGFSTNSADSFRQSLEKDARQKQLMLAGIGAISLFVAAIGITNTMIMSISERTREIGIMKALGCYVRDIRTLFLMESGFIGLLGGIGGILISGILSIIMNLVSSPMPADSIESLWAILFTPGSRISVMPWWLLLFSLVFSIVIGLLAGYYPARKAVKIPALEAIKHE